jgi:hypothetical protein
MAEGSSHPELVFVPGAVNAPPANPASVGGAANALNVPGAANTPNDPAAARSPMDIDDRNLPPAPPADERRPGSTSGLTYERRFFLTLCRFFVSNGSNFVVRNERTGRETLESPELLIPLFDHEPEPGVDPLLRYLDGAFPEADGPYEVRRQREEDAPPVASSSKRSRDPEDELARRRVNRLAELQAQDERVSRSRAKVMPPVKFSAKDKPLQVRLWLKLVSSYLSLMGEEPRRWVLVAETYLEGVALARWSLSRPDEPTWVQFSDFLTLHFGDAFLAQDTRAKRASLRVLGRITAESVARLGSDLEELHDRAALFRSRVGDDEAVEDFLTCLLRSGPEPDHTSGRQLVGRLEGHRLEHPDAFANLSKVVKLAANLAGVGVAEPAAGAERADRSERRGPAGGNGASPGGGSGSGHGTGRAGNGNGQSGNGSKSWGNGKGGGSGQAGGGSKWGKGKSGQPSGQQSGQQSERRDGAPGSQVVAVAQAAGKDLTRIPREIFEERRASVNPRLCLWCGRAGHPVVACQQKEPLIDKVFDGTPAKWLQKGPGR